MSSSDFTRSGEELLAALINEANPGNNITPTDLTFGQPVVQEDTDFNTALEIGHTRGLFETKPFYYSRLELDRFLQGKDLAFDDPEAPLTSHSVAQLIAERYPLRLAIQDILQETVTVDPAQYPVPVTLVAKADSLAWLGDVQVTLRDPRPTVTLQGLTPTVGEGGQARFRIVFTKAARSSRVINLSYSGTATRNSDYTAPATVTVAAGDLSAEFVVTITDDLMVEGDETLTVTIQAGTGYKLGTTLSANTTITDNDTYPTISIGNAAAVMEGGKLIYAVSLNKATQEDLAIPLSFGGTAVRNTHYTANAILNLSAGTNSGTVEVSTVDDNVVNDPRTVTVTLGTGAKWSVGTATGSGTINNDDVAPPPVVSIANATAVTEGNNLTFAITLDTAPSANITLNLGYAGTAVRDTHYTAASTLMVPGGATTATLTVTTVDNNLVDGVRSVTVTIQPGTGYTVGSAQTGAGNINDNDTHPTVNVADAATVIEGASLIYAVSLDKPTPVGITIPLTYTGTATPGVSNDFVGPASLTINAGQSSASINVATVDDNAIESSETVIVTLGSGSNYILGSKITATGTIQDNDTGVAPLMFASGNNVIQNGRDASSGASRDSFVVRWPYVLGSGNLSELRLMLDAWSANYTNNSVVDVGNVTPVQAATLEIGGVVRPFQWAGQPGVTLNSGDSDIVSDALLPSAFNLTEFARGTTVWVKVQVKFPTTGCVGLTTARYTVSGSQVIWYDSATATVSSINNAGAWTVSGGSSTTRTGGWVPTLLGRYTAATTPEVWCFCGDSITQGTGDSLSSGRLRGNGWPSRAMLDADDASNQISYYNMAVHGSTNAVVAASPKMSQRFKYANHGFIMYGTNNLGNAGNGQTLQQLTTAFYGTHDLMTGTGSKITKVVGGHLFSRTTTTDQYVTEENQAYMGIGTSTGWAPGGVADQYNQMLSGLVGGRLVAVVTWNSVRGVDKFKWKVDGTVNYMTTDGTHPSSAACVLAANDARSVFRAVTATA